MIYTKQELLDAFCERTGYDGSVTKVEWYQNILAKRIQELKKHMKNMTIRYLNGKIDSAIQQDIEDNKDVELN